MDMGAYHAAGDVFLFLHADTQLPVNAGYMIEDTLQNQRVVYGAFRLAIYPQAPVLSCIAFAANLRTRLFHLPYGDQAIFVRRKHYFQAGGFPHWPLMEDVALVRRLNSIGRFGLASGFVRTSARRWKQETVFFTTLRNWSLLLRYFCGVSPYRLSRHYGHKR
jgi:hypothetical protein